MVVDWSELHGPLLQPRLTHALMTPPMLRGLLAAPEDAYPRNEGLMLLVGGGTMSWAEVLEAKRRITPHVYNRLAATEVTAYGMTLLETPEDLRWHRISPEAEVQVVDEDDRPLPPGQMGSVRVGAAGGPNGYLDDTEASAAFFRQGYFYPGDLGVLREDGRLALQGRVTDVINIDGVKIAPGPIEDRIREATGSSAVLLTMQNDAGEEELHVAIEAVTAPPTNALSKVLRAELAQARRAHVHVMAAFPRNAMGKVMRAQLTAQIVSALRAKGPAS